jgi:WD40 repeat protein
VSIGNGKFIRGHDGTVYSIDAYWKYGHSDTSHKSQVVKVAPSEKECGSRTVNLVTGSHDQYIIQWEVQSGFPKNESIKVDQIKKMKGHVGDVYALELTLDESLARFGNLVSGGDYTVRTWNLNVKIM